MCIKVKLACALLDRLDRQDQPGPTKFQKAKSSKRQPNTITFNHRKADAEYFTSRADFYLVRTPTTT